MATVPLSGTDITFYSGVPFSNDYKNTRWFDNITEQNTYFTSRTVIHQIAQAVFQRGENGQSFVRVNQSIDALRNVNYLRFRNTYYESKWFYAFVTKLEYKNESMTIVHFEIDVIQTWRFNWTFQPSFVEREHRPQYNADGTPIIHTIDEGLDYGDEYDTVWVKQVLPNQHKWLVIIAKEQLHDLPGGNPDKGKIIPTVVGSSQPLSVYIAPYKDDDTVPNVVLPSGAGALVSKPSDILKGIYTDTDAVSNVVSIFVTDYTGIVSSYSEGSNTITFAQGNTIEAVQVSDGASGFFNFLYVKKVKNFGTHTEDVGDKYDGYASVTESKLLMYPYTVLTLDDFKGNRATFKNEHINGTRLLMNVKGSLGTSNKVSYGFSDYNYKYDGTLENEIADEYALINNEPNDIPIITDLLAAYLQGNKNQIQTQKDSALFGGIMGVTGAVIGGVASAVTRNPLGVLSSTQEGLGSVGNAMLQTQAINAKQKDIGNIPANLTKMGSNTSYSMGNDYDGVFVIKKQIKPEYRKKLSDFFKMYGYKANELKVPNFHTRQTWNYVKTISCNIIGDFNNEDLNEIKVIFDNGITLWHTDSVGDYSLANGVI